MLPGDKVMSLTAAPMDQWKKTYGKLVAKSKALLRPQADAVRQRVIGEAVEADVANGVTRECAERRWSLAYEDRVLRDDFELVLDDGSRVTVAEVLDNGEKFEGERCCDPIEPEYSGDSRVAVLYPSRGLVWSHAHGGISYFLGEPATVNNGETVWWMEDE